ncbi:outer membrane lipoprotein Blc-like [Acropora muricata]|uniref:outer membrane lipoprotein Blc-like n=1 Tax=Acropora muricata TaxID=159855 RepID=UPI0034E39257
MRIVRIVALLVFALSNCNNAFGIDTVPSLNRSQYIGRWYQVYADGAVVLTFERHAVCVTADYTLRKDGKIGVVNSERLYTETGEGKNITGYVYLTDPKQPGKLTVHLQGTPADLPYWVVKLGPASFGEQNLYQYSIVTDNQQFQLYVLARDVDTFKSQYDEEVKSWLADHGFTKIYNKPVPILQNKNCLYPKPRVSPYQTLMEFLSQQ